MIVEEPILQAKIAHRLGSEPELIRELAEEQDLFLALPSLVAIICKHYHESMPENLKTETLQIYDAPIYIPKFSKSFLELLES